MGIIRLEWSPEMLKYCISNSNEKFLLHSRAFQIKECGSYVLEGNAAIFYDMMHDCIEDFVDDILIKSKEVS